MLKIRRILISTFSSKGKISPVQLLSQRKLHYQSTSPLLNQSDFISKQQQKILNGKPVSVYCGYDPTADSLHLGNLVSIIMMARLHCMIGLRPIFLLGGATGLIGDPSGKKEQRSLLAEERVSKNLSCLQQEISTVYNALQRDLRINAEEYGCQLITPVQFQSLFVNNYDFYKNMNVLDYLRDIGKVLRMNSLLNKEIVANRLESEAGLSYTQFSYSILQAYDFYQLHQKEGCCIQLGGSDQWGNITNGCDLVRRFTQGSSEVYGMTMPLLLSKTGQKFGKSEGNALYLNKQKTPTSQIYDYLLSTPDSQIDHLLHVFTFYSVQKIERVMLEHKSKPENRIAQKLLAQKITSLLGGYRNLKEELLKLTPQELFAKNEEQIKEYFNQLPNDIKFTNLMSSWQPQNINNLPDLLCSLKITATKKEARRQIDSQGVYLNNAKIPKEYAQESLSKVVENHQLKGRHLLIRRGKKKCFLIKFV